jgi:hypothetical protein
MIERSRLVEARQLDRPFDTLAAAIERQTAVALTCDGQHAAIEHRREGGVHCEFGLAGAFAFAERGEI